MSNSRPPITITLTDLLYWSDFAAATLSLHYIIRTGFIRRLPDHTPIIILNFALIDRAANRPPAPTLPPDQLSLLKFKQIQRARLIAQARKLNQPIIL